MRLEIYRVLYGSTPTENDVTSCPFKHLFTAILYRAVLDLECIHEEEKRTARAWISNGKIGKITFNQVVEAINLNDDQVTFLKELAFESRKI